ncbi:MAG: hypothetical protein ACFFCF_05515 [Promethearchaeota archaeon]
MPQVRNSRIASLGIPIGIGIAVILYITQPYLIQPIVYTTYITLIDPLQLYELAWIMATIDLLLNFSFQFSFLLWIAVTIIIALFLRKLHITLSTLSAAILLPAGTWLLFTIKYLYLPGFSIGFLLSFLIWQTLLPLGITLGLATLITLPFIIYQRQKSSLITAPISVKSTCTKCGAVYRSKPQICIQCGEEGTLIDSQ